MESRIKEREHKAEIHKDFLSALHQEKIQTQKERTDYVKAKLIFVSALFGLGSVKIGDLTNATILYFIPFIAVGYDLYIHAADKSIKKIGAFLRDEPEADTSNAETKWEQISSLCRDRSARITNTLFSTLVTLASAIYLCNQMKSTNQIIFFCFWIVCCLVFIGVQGYYQLQRIDEIDKGYHIKNSTKKATFWEKLKRYL
jgi:hypothetical protein